MNKKNIEFDHLNDNFHDAIDLSKDELHELLKQSKKIFRTINKKKKSIAVEEILNIINNMDHKEISVIIFLLLDHICHRVNGPLLDKVSKMIDELPPKLPDSDDKFNLSYM